ncbi:MAG: hypothetical protein K0V04_38000, partial [Deltaproteobacteria bacterium]|nr:hypothetical protein [Deltaproteobacteria bacterium]
MSEPTSRLDPFDAALVVGVLAAAAFAGMLMVIAHYTLLDYLAGIWLICAVLSGAAWLTLGTWTPRSSRTGGLLVLVAFIVIEAIALAPLVLVGWDVAGPRAVLGAGMATGMVFAGLVLTALLKPTTELEPIDTLTVFGMLVTGVVVTGVGLGLPLRLLWATPLLFVTGVLALHLVARVAASSPREDALSGGTVLFGCMSVLFAELTHYFTTMVRPDVDLWSA